MGFKVVPKKVSKIALKIKLMEGLFYIDHIPSELGRICEEYVFLGFGKIIRKEPIVGFKKSCVRHVTSSPNARN